MSVVPDFNAPLANRPKEINTPISIKEREVTGSLIKDLTDLPQDLADLCIAVPQKPPGINLLLSEIKNGDDFEEGALLQLPEEAQDLESLCESCSLRVSKIIWQVLVQRLESLLSDEPTEDVTPGVWLLDKHAPTFLQDQQFLCQNLPSHKVVPIGRTIFLKGRPGRRSDRFGSGIPIGLATRLGYLEVGDAIAGNLKIGTLGFLFEHHGGAYGLTVASLSDNMMHEFDRLDRLPFFPSLDPIPLGTRQRYVRCGCELSCNCHFPQDFMAFELDQGYYPIRRNGSLFGKEVHRWWLHYPGPWTIFMRGAESGYRELSITSASSMVVTTLGPHQRMLIITNISTNFGRRGDSGTGLFLKSGDGELTFLGIFKGTDFADEVPQDGGSLFFTPADDIAVQLGLNSPWAYLSLQGAHHVWTP